MAGEHPVALFLGFIALVLGLAFYLNWRRRKGLEELAASMGAEYSEAGPAQEELDATGLELFRFGRARKASNLIRVRGASADLRVFDYRYTTGSGKSSQTHNFTVALIAGPRAKIPRFVLKPENFLHKIGEFVGFRDIDLEGFPVFSDKYRLTGPDEAEVRAFFTPQRAAWFERNLGLSVQGAPGYALFMKGERYLPVGSWQGFIEEARAFAAEALR